MGAVSRTSSGVVGLLAEPERLRVVSALALGAGTIPRGRRGGRAGPAGGRAGAAPAGAGRAGVPGQGRSCTLHAERFKEAAREAAPDEPGEPLLGRPGDRRGAAGVHPGRPDHLASRCSAARRRLLLEHVAAVFEPGVRYPEKEVNAIAPGLVRRLRHAAPLPGRRAAAGPGRRAVLADRRPGRGRPAGAGSGSSGSPRTGWSATADQVLLTRLGRSMHKGLWTLPGGGLDFGERPVDAVVRELHEETGLDVARRRAARRRRRALPGHPAGPPVRGARGAVPLPAARARRHARRGRGRRLHRRGAWWPAASCRRLTPLAERVLRTGRAQPLAAQPGLQQPAERGQPAGAASAPRRRTRPGGSRPRPTGARS